MVETTLVTARFLDLNGEPCSGTVTFTPPCIVRDNSGQAIMSGPISESLNSFGMLEMRVPCTDQDALDPQDWCYTITVRLDCADCVPQYKRRVPCGADTVRLVDLITGPTAGEDCRADTSHTFHTEIAGLRPANGTYVQDFTWDAVSQQWFMIQPMEGGIQLPGEDAPKTQDERALAGDMCISRMSPDGDRVTGSMYVLGFDHGQSIDAEPGTGMLWTGCNADADGRATGLARFVFQDGAILTPADVETHTPVEGGAYVGCAIDPTTDRIMFRYWMYADGANIRRLLLYRLEDAKAGRWEPIAEVAQPETGTLQGWASVGDYFYLYEGQPLNLAPWPGDVYLTTGSWVTGEVVQKTHLLARPDLHYREPEGITIRLREAGGWDLLIGLAEWVTVNGVAHREFNILSMPACYQETENNTMATDDCCGTVVLRGPKGDPGEPGPPGETNVKVTDPITVDGTGTEGDPFVIGLGLSTLGGNAVQIGSDGGVFVPALVWNKTNTYDLPGEGQAGKLLDFKSLTDEATADFIISRNSAGDWLTTWRQTGQILMYDRGNGYPGGHLRVYRLVDVPGTDIAAGFGGVAATTPTAYFTYDGQLTLDNAATTVTPTSGVGVYAEGDVFKVMKPDGSVIALNLSANEGNQLSLDASGNLYATASTNVGDNTYVVGEGLAQSGSGTAEDPYVLAVNISADAGNALTLGTDGGLYVPDTAGAEIGDWIDIEYDTANWTALRTPQYRLIGDKQAAIRFQLVPNEGFDINNSQPVTLPPEAVPAVSTYTAGSCSGSPTRGSGTVAPAVVRFDIHSAADDGKITIVDLRGIQNWVAVDAIYWLD